MARKEINIFSASFLDLLSGALGAVIILYILVPKLNIPVEEFEEQKKLSEEVGKLGVAIDDIANLIPQEKLDAIKSQMQEVISAKQALEKKIAGLQKALEECLKSNEENMKKIVALEQELKETKEALSNAESQVEDLRPYKEWMDNCGFSPDDDCPKIASLDVDVGFKFKGRNLLFIIDVSGSMDANRTDNYDGYYVEDRMQQVQAGVKMLVMTMTPEFNCDIIWFASTGGVNYEANWTSLKQMNENNKNDASKFLYSLRPGGGTPTGAVLEYALTNSGYQNLSDIILMSDGLPDEEEQEILNNVSRLNNGGIAIHTIGVGRHMIEPHPNDVDGPKAKAFLQELAKQNEGFFYGF